MNGAPMATPRAYPVTSQPAPGIDTPRSAATSGNRPMMTNSVVPMPKALKARMSSERGIVGSLLQLCGEFVGERVDEGLDHLLIAFQKVPLAGLPAAEQPRPLQ